MRTSSGAASARALVSTCGRYSACAAVMERVSLPKSLHRFVIPQGSITIEGVSLTVADASGDWIEVALIPETRERTNLGGLAAGGRVNIECDVIARYVERMVSPYGEEVGPVGSDFETAGDGEAAAVGEFLAEFPCERFLEANIAPPGNGHLALF